VIVESVRKISPCSDDAEVVIRDGTLRCRCFCQPCYLVVGQIVQGPLFAFNAQNLYRSEQSVPRFEALNRFAHRIIGELRALKPPVVRVGGIDVKLDTVSPGDWRVGEAVEFECERLDVIT
jgi:hypothetical protein